MRYSILSFSCALVWSAAVAVAEAKPSSIAAHSIVANEHRISVLAILWPENRVVVATVTKDSVVRGTRGKDIMNSFCWIGPGWGHVWPHCQNLLATVRADNHPEISFRGFEFHL